MKWKRGFAQGDDFCTYIRRDFGAISYGCPFHHVMKQHSIDIGKDKMFPQPSLSGEKEKKKIPRYFNATANCTTKGYVLNWLVYYSETPTKLTRFQPSAWLRRFGAPHEYPFLQADQASQKITSTSFLDDVLMT